MTIIAFISTAVLMFVVGMWFGAYCGRQATLDEIKKKENGKA